RLMSLSPQQALQKYFGFSEFRVGQEAVIERAVSGKHTLLVMPTGSGKSLTYQLPAMLKPGLTLVISPLIALMKDQVDHLVENGIPATYINSSLPSQEIDQRMRAVLEGDVKLLYIAPERLRNRQFTRTLANTKISMLAVDEAHCISQWGHDFRPDYLQIGPIWQAMGQPTLLATTATATSEVQQDIQRLLQAPGLHTLVTGFNRPNLSFQVKHAPNDHTKLQALQTLLNPLQGSAIVYVATRRNADEVADYIERTLNVPAESYHGGLDREIRSRVQDAFMRDQIKVVVATNAFGMGVDKADVRTVLHYNMPGTVEAYYQEAGRAGRDGEPAQCILLYAPEDQSLQEWFITNDTPNYEDLYQVYAGLTQDMSGDEVYVSLPELAHETGLHLIKIRVAISELEQASLIYHLGNQGRYDSWKILPFLEEALETQATQIQKRSEIRHQLLGSMLDYAHLMTCRRQYLLQYFGDSSVPDAPNCCDNHTVTDISDLPKAMTPQEWYPLIILDTVHSLENRPVGRNRLSQILSGSRSREIEQFGYDTHRFYGKLTMLSQKQIVSMVDQLVQQRYLSIDGGTLPVLHVTSLGQEALTARLALPVQIISSSSSSRSSSGAIQSNTLLKTLMLFNEGLSSSEIAIKRGIAERTIQDHLARLVGQQKIPLRKVASSDIEAQVLRAIEQIGTAFRLTSIKDILPEIITFEQIKCVIEAHPHLSKLSKSDRPSNHSSVVSDLDDIDKDNTTQVNAQGKHPLRANSEPDKTTPASNSTPTSEQVIREAVAKLGRSLGRGGLAKMLTGSREKWLEPYHDHSYYNRLSHLAQKTVINQIDDLIAKGELVLTGGHRPKVTLAEQIHNPTTTDDDLVDSSVLTVSSPQAEPVSELSELQPKLAETLRTWRRDQARQQEKPPFTIFSNKVIDAIAIQMPEILDALSLISGIGPTKLEQYGEVIIEMVRQIKTVRSSDGFEIHQTSTFDETSDTEFPSTLIGSDDTSTQLKEGVDSDLDIREAVTYTVADGKTKRRTPIKSQSLIELIQIVLLELDGLLTIQGLGQLLIASPGEAVPYSDHSLCGQLYERLSQKEVEQEIRKGIERGDIGLNVHQRVILG
ncbi:MAG: RecQ family ATP-dependent DNA helicase, partial [Chloroflexota bacterium]